MMARPVAPLPKHRRHADDTTRPRIPRQQGRPAQQALRGLRPADDLAPPLGPHLGRGEVLLRRLPARQGCAVAELRHLVLVLGDQLDLDAAAFDGFDAAHDAVWMAEVAEESTHVWSSKPRTVMFLAAMRHFAQALRAAGRPLHYTRLDDPANHGSLQAQLHADIERLRPAGLVMTAPGDWRVLQAIKGVAQAHGLPLDIREDRHFYCSVREFAAHARGRKSLRMEYFYREMRKRHGVLMQESAATSPRAASGTSTPTTARPSAPPGPAPCRRARCSSPMRSRAR